MRDALTWRVWPALYCALSRCWLGLKVSQDKQVVNISTAGGVAVRATQSRPATASLKFPIPCAKSLH